MYFFNLFVLLLFSGGALAAGNGYLIGGGVESDSESSLRVAGLAGVGFGERTWLSGSVARNTVELPTGRDSDTRLAALELDRRFDPLGVRIGASYWGDPDVLESNDWNAAVYFQSSRLTLAAEYDYRDFEFTIPRTDFFTGRRILFDADGFGGSIRLQISERVRLGAGGTAYDYSVDFKPTRDRDIVDLISATRLSLINTLVDNRAYLTVGLDRGLRHWEIDVARTRGAVDGATTRSFTLRHLLPVGNRFDLELGLGYDDSDLYGDVTFFSMYLYFYGGS
jgi:hypothetical protein